MGRLSISKSLNGKSFWGTPTGVWNGPMFLRLSFFFPPELWLRDYIFGRMGLFVENFTRYPPPPSFVQRNLVFPGRCGKTPLRVLLTLNGSQRPRSPHPPHRIPNGTPPPPPGTTVLFYGFMVSISGAKHIGARWSVPSRSHPDSKNCFFPQTLQGPDVLFPLDDGSPGPWVVLFSWV